MPLDFRNTNSLWASVLVETMARVGVRQAVISPGSRSTPLTVQLAAHPGIEAIPVLDERSAAFFALGLARRTRRPVVLLCTSGSAGANYLPAVIEARESGVPLVVITADRPPEMRECRSGQTIDQQKLFGGFVNFYHEMAVPEAEAGRLRYARQTVAHAVERALWPGRGPVHLNAPFRDPLPPIEDATAKPFVDRLGDAFFEHLQDLSREDTPAAAEGGSVALPRGRGVIVAGQVQTDDPLRYAQTVGRLARKLGWPVLADALSPLRNFASEVPGLVTGYDVIARSPAATARLEPEQVLCLHDWPTSKALREWLQRGDRRVTFVSGRLDNPDALHGRTRVLRLSIDAFARVVQVRRAGPAWVRDWVRTDRRVATALRRGIAETAGVFEGRVAATLPALLPRGTTLMVANSMPVRDAEYFWPANDRHHVLHCNRGANGIDGNVSTAIGLAHRAGPTVLVTGDLAFLHDSNALLLAERFVGALTIVVINNEGGGIFEHLPVVRFDPPFEDYFATPQRVDLGRLCSAHGVRHVAVRHWSHFEKAVAQPGARGVRVLELRTGRKADAATRKALFAQIAARLT